MGCVHGVCAGCVRGVGARGVCTGCVPGVCAWGVCVGWVHRVCALGGCMGWVNIWNGRVLRGGWYTLGGDLHERGSEGRGGGQCGGRGQGRETSQFVNNSTLVHVS